MLGQLNERWTSSWTMPTTSVIPMTARVWAIAFAVCPLLLATAAQAALFVVNSTVDSVDALPGDAVCADASGACTLRAAVMETNALEGADVVLLPAGTYVLGIAGVDEDAAASGDLDITQDLTLVGDGSDATVIDANGIDRVLHVPVDSGGPNVDVAGMTLTGGSGVLFGGGIENRDGSVTLDRSTVSGNQAIYWGGGISNDGGMLRLRHSTVSSNSATILGGGIAHTGKTMGGKTPWSTYCFSGPGSGKLVLTNSTVSGNSASFGSAIGLGFPIPYGHICCGEGLELTSSTVSANEDSGGFDLGGALTPACSETALVLVRNTIVANPGPDCSADFSGFVTSLGHNLDSDGTCNLTDPTDLPNTDPMLGALQDNGGATWTHALQLGSPAIDAIPEADCTYDDDGDPGTPEVPLTKDQRGVARPKGDRCDIGAYEVTACADGIDNDGDTFIDADDPGCPDAASVREDPQCQDGVNNDPGQDDLIDFDGGLLALGYVATEPDPQCVGMPWKNNEFRQPSCGLGAELALLLPALIWLRRRSRGSKSATASP